jgi:hypothetical protein
MEDESFAGGSEEYPDDSDACMGSQSEDDEDYGFAGAEVVTNTLKVS